MEILEKVKLILDIDTLDLTKDKKLQMLIDDAIVVAIDYCNLTEYVTKLDSIVAKMAIQDYNKARVQGINSESFSGVSESYINGYSADVYIMLNKNRKLKTI